MQMSLYCTHGSLLKKARQLNFLLCLKLGENEPYFKVTSIFPIVISIEKQGQADLLSIFIHATECRRMVICLIVSCSLEASAAIVFPLVFSSYSTTGHTQTHTI